jgi:hypothetical protein
LALLDGLFDDVMGCESSLLHMSRVDCVVVILDDDGVLVLLLVVWWC